MNRYEVFGENLVTERKSVIYEANSPEEAIAMAKRDIENHTYFFSRTKQLLNLLEPH
jgi:hypothetical protein